MKALDVQIQTLPETTAIIKTVVTSLSQCSQDIPSAFKTLFEWLAEKERLSVGYPFALYPDETFNPERFTVSLCVPVEKNALPSGIEKIVLPPMQVAQVRYQGPYDDPAFEATYRALFAWLADQPYRRCGPIRESYLNGPATVLPQDLLTDMAVPIESTTL